MIVQDKKQKGNYPQPSAIIVSSPPEEIGKPRPDQIGVKVEPTTRIPPAKPFTKEQLLEMIKKAPEVL